MTKKHQNTHHSSSNISKVETQFLEQKKIVDHHGDDIKKVIAENYNMDESDRIRLTRVLQLLEKYQPDRKIPKQQKTLLDALKSLYRFLPQPKKPKDKDKNAYLLAEQTIESLRKLRHYDYILRNSLENTDDQTHIVDQKISGKISSSEVLDTSLTLDYEKENW